MLLACYEVPGFGGASTATYALYGTLRADHHDVAMVNLIQEVDREFFDYTFGARLGNPEDLPGVDTIGFEGSLFGPQPALDALVARRGPAVVLAVGVQAALLMRRAAPRARLAFLTSGCQQAQAAIAGRLASDATALARRMGPVPPRLRAHQEADAVAGADLVFTHSASTLQFVRHYYAGWAGKIHPAVIGMAPWIHAAAARHAALARPFDSRGIDLLFVASTWDRREKNYPLVREIARRLSRARVHVVGDVPYRLPGVTHHGFLADQQDLFRLLGDARTVVCPSLIDAAPGVLFEASALGCNVVTSRNCGNWALCHADLLAETCAAGPFAAACARSLTARFPDHVRDFLETGSYEELVDTMGALQDTAA